jgi:hypothetical protein
VSRRREQPGQAAARRNEFAGTGVSDRGLSQLVEAFRTALRFRQRNLSQPAEFVYSGRHAGLSLQQPRSRGAGRNPPSRAKLR